MAQTYKILAQVVPGQGQGLTAVYTVPTGKQAIINRVLVCNYTINDSNVSIYVAPASETNPLQSKYIFFPYNATISKSSTTIIEAGMTLAAGDKVYVEEYYGANAVNVQLFGVEMSI